ncbi:gamma-glutamylcyclotransferase family protein [Sphingosinicella terrae]|jgi:hypothetical protein|uniref:gamma-glutamylcyclotransferase family protein n=1 Tax=Sphingosinicella terrae TaxID=2172047 RepID=UPI000E0DC714|nr:gamma-glutamylcyclotransferase family protein [Sphingosinicella terrae]
MTRSAEAPICLFSYGTLQQPEVQRATFGRLLDGRPDALAGYRLAPLVISDPGVIAASGLEVHTIACPTGDPVHRIDGIVFSISPAELAAADRYETDAYDRVEVILASGASAFVYIGPEITE